MAKRKQYSNEFKAAAVKQWQESGKSAAEMAKELEISTSSLYAWRDQYAEEQDATAEPATTEPAEELVEAAEEETELASESSEVEEAPAEQKTDVEAEQEEIPAGQEPVDVVEEAAEVAEELEPAAEKPVPAAVEGAAVAPVTEAPEQTTKEGDAKAIIKRILGVVGLLLGGIGLIFSIALIIVVWVVNKPVTDGAVELVAKVEIGLTVANNGLDQVDESLDGLRQKLRDVTEAVPLEGLTATITDIIAIVDGIQSTVDTATSVVGLADTFPVSLIRKESEPVETPKLDEASLKLGNLSAELGNVETVLVERQESGLGPLGAQVDTQINDLQSSIQEINQGVEEGINTSVQLQKDLPGIIDTIAIIFTLLFVWLGVAQYSLLVHGLHWVRWP